MSERLPVGSLYGHPLRSRKVGSFGLSERVYEPHYRTPPHSHHRALLCFVLQGAYTETYGKRTRECRASSMLFHPAEESHVEHFHEAGGHSFVIEIEPQWMDRLREQVALIDAPAEFHGGVLELLARRLYHEFVRTDGPLDGASGLVIEGLILEMIGEISRRRSPRTAGSLPNWLQRARELIHQRFAEPLTLAEIAGAVEVHPVHLAQMFHKSYRCTVGDYVRQRRIDYACHALAATETPIVEIALAAGFCDQSHFTRTFKRSLGVVPSQYRHALRGTDTEG
ncbi:MAG TPA: AraC family transcriptional regulator [Blastocatellia bacterium]|nr:AraC family transcriptional regulator [Blastocatellia bacterium]